jgi:hypothetical protein
VSIARQGTAGSSRICPHCRTVILESATICPACRHHLRFDPALVGRAVPSFSALRVEGAIRHPETGAPWEYSVVVSIRNERGEEIARHVVGVGALLPAEQRTFTFAVEVFTPAEAKAAKG